MIEFTASNGITVKPLDNGIRLGLSTGLNMHIDDITALREFFDRERGERWQDERDKELGRWRWPANPDYVVYQRPEMGEGLVSVFRESDAAQAAYHRNDFPSDETSRWYAHKEAARAYFEAHPERRPWEDAKHGEVWVLDIDGDGGSPWVCRGGKPTAFFERVGQVTLADFDRITSGRRIWPEDAS